MIGAPTLYDASPQPGRHGASGRARLVENHQDARENSHRLLTQNLAYGQSVFP
jgi:hypothetical protein